MAAVEPFDLGASAIGGPARRNHRSLTSSGLGGWFHLEPNRHVLDAANKARAQPLDRPCRFDVVEALGQLAENNLQLEPRQVRAEAEVFPDAEGDLRIRIAADGDLRIRIAADVELERIL